MKTHQFPRGSRALVIITALACLSGAVPAQGNEGGDYVKVFDRLWSTVNEKFFDPRMNGVDWRGVRARYRPEAARLTNDEAFQALGTRMLGELGVTHLRVTRPARTTAAIAGQTRRTLPVTTVRIDGVLYVKALRPDGADSGLRPGDRLSDLPTAAADATRVSINVEGCDGTPRTVDVALGPRSSIYEWRTLDSPGGERIGYFRLNRFDGEAAIAAADEAMAALADTDGLILDLRGNTGGDSSAIHLLNYFTEGSRPAMIMYSRGALARLGRMPTPAEALQSRKVLGGARFGNLVRGLLLGGGRVAAWTEGRGAAGYRRPVTVLVSGSTGSSGEAFAWGMKLLTPARLIGRTTGGALLSEESFDLPEGWSVTLPTYGLWGPDGASYVDRPVTPHETVAVTREDLCAARDRDMEAAFAHQDAAD